MAVKYKTAFNKLKAIWKRTGKVKGKKHAKWGGKRGAFSTIAKAASKEAAKKKKPTKSKKKTTARRKPAKRKPTKRKPAQRKAAKRKTPKRKAPARKKRAPKRSAPRAKRKQASNAKGATRRYVVAGKTRSITPYRAAELRKGGKAVRIAKTQKKTGGRRRSTRGKAGVGTLAVIGLGIAAAVGIGYAVTRKKA